MPGASSGRSVSGGGVGGGTVTPACGGAPHLVRSGLARARRIAGVGQCDLLGSGKNSHRQGNGKDDRTCGTHGELPTSKIKNT